MLVLSIILGLATRQVDHTTAFAHAPIDQDPNWDTLTQEEKEVLIERLMQPLTNSEGL